MINYSSVYSEVLEILKYMPYNQLKKIPIEIIKEFNSKKDNDTKINYDINKTLKEQNISKAAIEIISVLYSVYIFKEKKFVGKLHIINIEEVFPEEQLETIKAVVNNNKKNYRKIINEKIESTVDKIGNSLIVVKESIFSKFANKVKKVFYDLKEKFHLHKNNKSKKE